MKVTRIFDLPYYQLDKYNSPNVFLNKINGTWKGISSAELVQSLNNISFGLIEMGIQKGDRIATISASNRMEWNICDYGMLQTGAIHVPMYPTISKDDYEYIFNDAEIKICIVSDKVLYDKVNAIKDRVPTLKDIYVFDEVEGIKNYKDIAVLGSANLDTEKLQAIKDTIKEDDLATLIYTSGTTGKPKGVMLSHKNLVSNFLGGTELIPVEAGGRTLSFLPMCHIFERTVVYAYQHKGLATYYAESLETIGDNIKELHPEIFTAVPRLIEKVYDKIIAKGVDAGGIKAKIFNWAVDVTKDFKLGGNGFLYNLKHGIADKLVYSKIRNNLDPKLKCMVSGSAALQPRLAKFFWAIGMPILEGYGLTETSPIVTVNRIEKENTSFGSVGILLTDVSVRIAEDGEILVKGPNVMQGYLNRPEATAEVIDKDGWFHTGDIGKFEGKFLRITDRKKMIFKTSGGKYVAPQPIENKMKESPFIEQIMVCGEGEKHASALIVPSFEYMRKWCKDNGVECHGNEAMIDNEKVKKAIYDDVQELNKSLGKTETVKKFVLLPKEWCIEDGELTPTMKVKRKIITERCKDKIEGMYR